MSLDRFQLDPSSTALTVIDIQDRLAGAMKSGTRKDVERQVGILVKGAAALEVPVLVTEQYPKGLGPTVGPIRKKLPEGVKPIEKTDFNCAAVDGYVAQLKDKGIKTVVLTGMEAHICVLQTALGLMNAGYHVWVAEDAICSRRDAHRKSALKTLRDAGAVVAPTESILFGLLKKAGGPAFKVVSQLIK